MSTYSASTNRSFQRSGTSSQLNSPSSQQPASLETALLQISYKEYKSALVTLKALLHASPQHPTLLYHLGHCYMNLHQYKDAEKAYLMSGTPQALFECYELYLDQKQYEAALEILKKSQSIDALLELVRILEDVFHPLYRFRTKVDFGKVKCLLGTRYLLGEDGLDVNEKRALQLYKESADLGYASGYTGLAYLYEHGLAGLEVDMDRAIQLYTDAAQKGCVRAMGNLGNCYLEGVGVPVDEEEALKWLSRAAKEGDTDSMTALGLYYARKQEGALAATPSTPAPVQTTQQPSPQKQTTSTARNSISHHQQPQITSSPLTKQQSSSRNLTTTSTADSSALKSTRPEPVTEVLQPSAKTPSLQRHESNVSSTHQRLETPRPEDDRVPMVTRTDTAEQLITPRTENGESVFEDTKKEHTLVDGDEALTENLSTTGSVKRKSTRRRKKGKRGKRFALHNIMAFTSLILNCIVLSVNLLGMLLSVAGVATGVCLYVLYSTDKRFIYCLGAALVSFVLHLGACAGGLVCYFLPTKNVALKWASFINLAISFGCTIATISFTAGLGLILGILHESKKIDLTTWAP